MPWPGCPKSIGSSSHSYVSRAPLIRRLRRSWKFQSALSPAAWYALGVRSMLSRLKAKMRRAKVTHLSDETLMAYADGQLAPDEMIRIEQLLASDPKLLARFEVFRTTGHDLAALFDDHFNAPLAPGLKRFT